MHAVRYPGGNFVSGYRWEDGVGPRELRPRRLDLAWHGMETNEIGLHEFMAWARPGRASSRCWRSTSAPAAARPLDLLEYANLPGGTRCRTCARANGVAEPFGVRMWCLGNEMDGPWQIGHKTAEEYGRLAAETARAMRLVDPGLELVACGCSAAQMPTFGEWERTVLSTAYDDVDYISAHAYYESRTATSARFLASGVDMDRFIDGVVAAADDVRAAQAARTSRSTSRSTSGTSGTSAAHPPRSPNGLAAGAHACSRTCTRWPTPWSSATCSSRCCATRTGCRPRASPSSSTSSRRS